MFDDMYRIPSCRNAYLENIKSLSEERRKNKEINKKSIRERLILLRGHHLKSFKNYLLPKEETPSFLDYGEEFYKNENELYTLLLEKSNIKIKIIENGPDFICNGNCLERRTDCFTDGDSSYDKKIASKFGFEIDKIYSSQEMIRVLLHSKAD